MEEVKISYNKATWNKEGAYYKGCYSVTREVFLQFKEYVSNYMKKFENKSRYTGDEMYEMTYLPSLEIEKDPYTKKDCVFLKITQNNKFISFLKEVGIPFKENRATGDFNYYLEIKN